MLDWLLNSIYVIFCDFKFQGAASAVGDKYRMVLTWVCKRGIVLDGKVYASAAYHGDLPML